MQSWSKGASVWVDGWVDRYDLLLEVMAFLSRITQLLLSSPGQYLPSVFPTTINLCGAQGRIRTGHTCIPYIIKSKRRSMERQVMQSWSKGASVWVGGWMDMAYSLRHWFSLLTHPLFLNMATPSLLYFLFFFGSCFFGMPSFPFLGQP